VQKVRYAEIGSGTEVEIWLIKTVDHNRFVWYEHLKRMAERRRPNNIYIYRVPGQRRKKGRSRKEHGNKTSGKRWNIDSFKKDIYIYIYICIYMLHISAPHQPPTEYPLS
jgi:hypothetical protein